MIKTCLARIVGVGKDVQRFQASVILRAFFTAFPCFHLTTMSMKGFIPWRYFKKEQRHIKGKQNKTLKSDVFAEFTKHVQQSTGLSCVGKGFHYPFCSALPLSHRASLEHSMWKVQGQPLKW